MLTGEPIIRDGIEWFRGDTWFTFRTMPEVSIGWSQGSAHIAIDGHWLWGVDLRLPNGRGWRETGRAVDAAAAMRDVEAVVLAFIAKYPPVR